MDDIEAPIEQPSEETPTPRLRVVFAAPAGDKPFQALRTGTFTDMYGRESTFTEADLLAIADSINRSSRKLPINEGHDYGRAVGRMLAAEVKYSGRRLYITPKWNGAGRALLEDEAYDGFSIELERGKASYAAIGGALTNYPAVDGLSPLSLEAPPAGPSTLVLPAGDEPDDLPAQMETPMSDTPTPQAETPPASPVIANDPAIASQLAAFGADQRAWFLQQMELVRQQAQDEARRLFEAQQAEQRREAAVVAFAQHVTTPTLKRPHALPFRAEQIADALRGLNDAQRAKVEAVLQGVVDSGLVAFDQVGAAGDGEGQKSAQEEYDALVFAKVDKGMSRLAAIQAVNRERPDLYRSLSAPKGGR